MSGGGWGVWKLFSPPKDNFWNNLIYFHLVHNQGAKSFTSNATLIVKRERLNWLTNDVWDLAKALTILYTLC